MSTSVQITVAQYDEMIARGEFEPREEHHVELLEGEIVAMSPIGNEHEICVDALTEWSVFHAPMDAVIVRIQHSIRLTGTASVPQPDVAWVRRRKYSRRPETDDVFLVIEVADSSLSKDRGPKARLYAGAGIADYWIVNTNGRTVEVRRDPRDGMYLSVAIHRVGDVIPLLAFPEIAFPVNILFLPDAD